MKKDKLLIVGSGELGQQIAHYAKVSGQYRVIGFIDDFQKKNTIIGEYQILGNIDDIENIYAEGVFDKIIIGIGYKHLRKRKEIYDRLSQNIPFATIIVAPAYIDETAVIEPGTIIYPGTIIDKKAHIGPNNIINLKATIAHNSVIGSSNFIAAGAIFAGFTTLGDCNMIGIGALIKDNTSIRNDILVGMGSTVIRNLFKKGSYFGNPAKMLFY